MCAQLGTGYTAPVPVPVNYVPPVSYSNNSYATANGVPLGSTPAQSIANQAIYGANNTIASAYSSAIQPVNNSVQNTTYVYNNTVQQVSNDTANYASAIGQTIANIDSHVTSAVNNTLAHAIDAINSADREAQNNYDRAIANVTNLVNDIHTAVNNQARIDLTPIRDTVDNITNAIREESNSYQRDTQAFIQNFYDAQTRQLETVNNNSHDVIKAVSDDISQGFARVTESIDRATGGGNGIFGVSDDQITELLKKIGALLGKAIREFAIASGLELNQAAQDKLKVEAANFGDVPNRFSNLFKRLLSDKYDTIDEFISDLAGGSFNHLLIDLVFNILTGLSGAAKINDLITAPYYQKLIQLSLASTTPNIPQIQDAIRFHFRGLLTETEYNDYMAKLGINSELALYYKTASEGRLHPDEYLRNTYINHKPIDELRGKLHQLQFNDEEIDLIIENYQGGIPPIQDLIRFMVRDTFSPIAETYGQFEDFPEEIMQFWHAQPIGDKWAKHYWGSHWQLPSVQQVIEMFHRRKANSDSPIISYEELQAFLKSADIMPFWRDKLTQVAYNPITRIDVRRIYNMGKKDRHWVYNRYLDAGYSPESANDLADFVVQSQSESDETINKHIRKLAEDLIKMSFEREVISSEEARIRLINVGMNAREAAIRAQLWQFDRDTDRDYRKAQADKERMISQVRTDYEKRIIDRQYATSILLSLGHSQQDAETELKYSDLRATLKLKELKYDAIRTELVKWRIQRAEAETRLQSLGATQSEILYLLEIWTAEREKKDRQLSETDVNKIFKAGKMTDTRYRQYMTTLGFDSEEIEWLLELNKPDVTQLQ